MFMLIIGNAVVMATYSYDISEPHKKFMEISDYCFDICFLLEMIFKLIGLGSKNYRKDPWNVFDGGIVIVSFVPYIFSFMKFIEVN